VYKNILVTTDGSEFAEQAIGHAVELAKAFGAKLTGVTVTPPFQVIAMEGVVVSEAPDQYEKWAKQTAEARLATVKKAAQAAGVAFDTVHVEDTQPYAGIIEAAKRKGCDLIVMASHGRRGVSALLLGSETQKVLTHSTIPVLVYRPPAS
jgi:nucleotide-binding universal stress UspA family protein